MDLCVNSVVYGLYLPQFSILIVVLLRVLCWLLLSLNVVCGCVRVGFVCFISLVYVLVGLCGVVGLHWSCSTLDRLFVVGLYWLLFCLALLFVVLFWLGCWLVGTFVARLLLDVYVLCFVLLVL